MAEIDRPEDVCTAFAQAWNAHDMAALGALFHKDARFVNRFGRYVRGVDAIIAMHAPIHETVYRDSRLENELIDATLIGEDAASVYFWSRLILGTAHPAGEHTVDTVVLAVLTRRGEGWRIQAFENVTVVDPRTGVPALRALGSQNG